jgi:dTMP kinase
LTRFITFEGPDGSGKTTQARLFAEHLQTRGYPVEFTREPGGTAISEQIREVILSKRNLTMQSETEALLFSANLFSRSLGKEPKRRVRIYGSEVG